MSETRVKVGVVCPSCDGSGKQHHCDRGEVLRKCRQCDGTGSGFAFLHPVWLKQSGDAELRALFSAPPSGAAATEPFTMGALRMAEIRSPLPGGMEDSVARHILTDRLRDALLEIDTLNVDRAAALRSSGDAERDKPVHSDDHWVDLFATAMKAKLQRKRNEGARGWDDPDQCTVQRLRDLLARHIEKGDMTDVGNFAMMLWARTVAMPDMQSLVNLDNREKR